MSPSLRRLGLVAAIALVSSSAQAQSSEEQAVRAVVKQLFDGMRAADTAMVRSVFAPGAHFASVNARTAPGKIQFDTVGGWINAIAASNRRWDEQIYDISVRVDGNIAQVWAPYTFYLDKAVSHCGVDAMALLKDAGGWKLTELSDTRRRDNCPDPLKTRPQ